MDQDTSNTQPTNNNLAKAALVVGLLALAAAGLATYQLFVDHQRNIATDAQLRTDVQYLKRSFDAFTTPGYQPVVPAKDTSSDYSIVVDETVREAVSKVFALLEKNRLLNAFASKLSIPAPYLVSVKKDKFRPEFEYISIENKPGTLFKSSGGPWVPAADDPEYFIDGMEITISPADKSILDNPRVTKTKYPKIWEDKADCEAGCYGTIYLAETKNYGYFGVQVDSNNFDEKKLQTIVDIVLATLAAQ